jgi:predicted DCC family thiol-disulfide oxidoreductase YuxK
MCHAMTPTPAEPPAMPQELTPDLTPDLTIVYDGDCPFCAAYARMTRLRAAAGRVALVNAREDHPVVWEARAAGLDLDEGMVVKAGGRLYHGDAAMTLLAGLTTPSGLFNRVTAWAFRNPARARVIYPPMVAGRALTLRLLGRRKLSQGAQ